MTISLQTIKTQLRDGPYTWPGGYPKYFITEDGASLAFSTVRAEWRQIVAAHLAGQSNGWLIAECDINWEDCDLWDDHTGNRLESAYADVYGCAAN